MIGIVDYGVGNLFSLKSSIKAIGFDTVVSGDRDELSACERIILPAWVPLVTRRISFAYAAWTNT